MNKNNNSPLGRLVTALAGPAPAAAARPKQAQRAPRRRDAPRPSLPMALPSRAATARQQQAPRLMSRDQIGSVVRTRLTRSGVSDIRGLRVSWVIGYTFVGNGTNGATDAVLFRTKTNLLCDPFAAGVSSGQVPIAGSDPQLGAAYLADIEKHFARKVIRRQWLHVDSLQPSTANNMMCVIAPYRGGGTTPYASFSPLATVVAGNTVENVSSMKGAFPIDSWESKTVDITDYIAGGSGARQNEFEIGATDSSATSVTGGDIDGEGLIPSAFAVAGNSTTTALRNTNVHQIVVEQEIDLLDYVGGMAQASPIN